MLELSFQPHLAVQAFVDLELRSLVPDHRPLIHQKISEHPQNQNFSVSHCRLAGGFAVGPRFVGIDLEDASRVTKELIMRVATNEEAPILKSASVECYSHYWVAKEASWKCLNRGASDSVSQSAPPSLISQLTVQFLNKQNLNYFTCHWSGHTVYGQTLFPLASEPNLIMAICELRPFEGGDN